MFDEGIASRQLGEQLAVDDVAVYVARSLAAELPPSPGKGEGDAATAAEA
jgi:hypothetical protein